MGCCQGYDDSLMVVDYSSKNGSVGWQLNFGGGLFVLFYCRKSLESVAGVVPSFSLAISGTFMRRIRECLKRRNAEALRTQISEPSIFSALSVFQERSRRVSEPHL